MTSGLTCLPLNHLCHFLLSLYWLIFLLAMDHMSLLFSFLVIFDWVIGIMSFTLLPLKFCCISLNELDFLLACS